MNTIFDKSLREFVAHWGFCPHIDGELCRDCFLNPSERSFSYEDLTTLNHERQIAIFGFCSCEDNDHNENPYDDCPRHQEVQIKLGR